MPLLFFDESVDDGATLEFEVVVIGLTGEPPNSAEVEDKCKAAELLVRVIGCAAGSDDINFGED